MSDTDTLPKISDTDDASTRTTSKAQRTLDLSLTQVLGGAAAAATAAALGAKLGVAGTIAGAAVISLISAIAGSLYTASLRRTRAGVKAAVVKAGSIRAGSDDGTAVRTSVEDTEPAEDSGSRDDPPARARRRIRPWHVIVVAVGSFVVAIAGITGYELATGTSLDGTPGTTIQQVERGGGYGAVE